jgi:hypothetical protein
MQGFLNVFCLYTTQIIFIKYFYLALFNSVTKKLFLGRKIIGKGLPPPIISHPKLRLYIQRINLLESTDCRGEIFVASMSYSSRKGGGDNEFQLLAYLRVFVLSSGGSEGTVHVYV